MSESFPLVLNESWELEATITDKVVGNPKRIVKGVLKKVFLSGQRREIMSW